MTELSNLLKSSQQEFKDKKNNITAIPCLYYPGDNGFPYLIKNTANQILISGALHISTDQEQLEHGIYDTGYVAVNTQQEIMAQFTLTPDVVILDYKGFTLGVNKSGEFNSEAQTYHYTGEVLLNRNEQYIILDEAEASTLILSDSTTKWLSLATHFGIPVFPSFVSTINLNQTHLIVNVTDSVPLNNVHQTSDTILKQYKRDKIKLYLINATQTQAQLLAQKIFDCPLQFGYFGVQNFVAWKTINEFTQRSFGLKQNIRTMDITINYQLDIATSNAIKYFKQISATINGVEFSTPEI